MITFFKKRKTGSLLLLAAIFLTNVNLYAEDSEKAVKKENTAKDDGKTFFEMGISSLKDEEYKKAYENFFRAATVDYPEAYYYVGWCFENGVGAPQDFAKAAIYYQKGEKTGDTGSIYQLAGLYKNGKGVEQDFTKALHYYSSILEANRNYYGEYDDRVVTLLADIGEVYTIQEEYEKALENYRKALKISELLHGNQTEDSFKFTKSIAKIQLLNGEYEKSKESYEKVLQKLDKLKNSTPSDKAEIYDSFGKIAEESKNYPEAIKNYETALVFYQAAATIGNAFAALDDSLSESDEEDGGAGEVVSDDDTDTGDAAIEVDTESIESAWEYLNLARIYYFGETKEELETALQNAQTALSLAEHFSSEPVELTARANVLLCGIYYKMNENAKALDFASKSYTLNRIIWGKTHPETLYSLKNLAILSWLQKKNYKDGATYLSMLFSACSQTQGYGEALDILYDLYMNWQTAPKKHRASYESMKISCLNTAMDIVSKVSTMSLTPSVKEPLDEKCLAFNYIALDYWAKRKSSQKAFQYAQMIKLYGSPENFRKEKLENLPGLTDKDKKTLAELNSSIMQFSTGIVLQSLKKEGERDETSIYAMSQKLTENRRSLEILERDIAKRVPAYIPLKKNNIAGLDEVRTWCTEGKAILEYIIWEEKYSDCLKTKPEDSFKIFSLEELAAKVLEEETVTDKKTITVTTTVPREKINSWCLVISRSGTTLTAIESDFDYGTTVTNLRNLLLNRKELSEGRFSEYRTALYDRLIHPVENALPDFTTEVLIEPDNSLSYLPFDILGNGEELDFGEKYAVSFSGCISLSLKKQRNKPKGNYRVLAFGNPIYSRIGQGNNRGIISHTQTRAETTEGLKIKDLATVQNAKAYFNANGVTWKNLPGTGSELHKLQDKIFASPAGNSGYGANSGSQGGTPASAISGNIVTLIEGINASEETLKELSKKGSLGENSIIHFACHTYIDNTFPLMTSLVFSDASDARTVNTEDGYLTLPEAANLNLNADLVMISACQTDIKELTNGKSVTSLAESFNFAGANRVGLALWNVDDEATCIFFERLYRKLQTKAFRTGELSWAAAFRESKEELKLEKNWDNPYYWASFVLFE